MRRSARFVLVLMGLALVGAVAASSPAAAAGRSDVVGHVYVNDNTANGNTVAGFERHADGSLTAIPGSPFQTGGSGTGSGIGSQGALQASADGRYLLAADAGSNEISVLRIKPDGSLMQADTVSSGGNEPVSIAVNGSLVYVANAGDGGSNYTGFTLNAGGQLRPLAGSTFALPDGSSPGDVLFNGDGSRLVGVRVNTSVIDSFSVDAAGHLTAAPGSPYTAQGLGPFGSEFRPTNGTQLFVSNAHDGAGNGTVSAFNDATDGSLTSIGTSPYPDFQTAPCWVEISHDGQFLFTVNTASSSISRYSIAADGTLALLGSTPFNGAGAFDARLTPDGSQLFLVEDGSNAIGAFSADGGSLTELTTSPTPLPAGAAPFGIVVT